MSGGRLRSVHDMEIDEVSLVDRPANQHAALLIAKRAGGAVVAEEDETEVEFWTLEGQPLTEDMLTDGLEVVDADGQHYRWTGEDDAAVSAETDLDAGADSAFLADAGSTVVGKSLADTFREELTKAQNGGDLNKVIAKMSQTLTLADQRVALAEQRAASADEIAKSEQDLRLTREYVAKAAEYNVPVDPATLGPVLKRMEQQMSFEDCVVIDTILKAAGSMLFAELGFQGGQDGADPMTAALAEAEGTVAKGASSEEAIEQYFEQNPGAYADYLAGR